MNNGYRILFAQISGRQRRQPGGLSDSAHAAVPGTGLLPINPVPYLPPPARIYHPIPEKGGHIEVQGASPAKVGAQIVFLPIDRIVGTVGGGKQEDTIHEDMKASLMYGLSSMHHCMLAQERRDAFARVS